MDPSLPSQPPSLPPGLSKRETLSHTAQGELQDASATSREEAQKKERGYQDGQVSLSQKPVWLVLEREGAVTQNQRYDSVRL